MSLFDTFKGWFKPASAAKTEPAKVDYSALTVPELRKLVRERGERPRKLNKAELVELLNN